MTGAEVAAAAPAGTVAGATSVARPVAVAPSDPREPELVAAWLLGRVPAVALAPWRLVRAGRAGRGAGPDVREAAVATPDGVLLAGDVEVHVRASDYARHGHLRDAAYGRVIAQLVWVDDAAAAGPGGGPGWPLRTIALAGPLHGDPARLRALLRAGPAAAAAGAAVPCAAEAAARGAEWTREAVRAAGRERMAELAWRAGALAVTAGWEGAWAALLERALAASAGRRAETSEQRAARAATIDRALRAGAGSGAGRGMPEVLARVALAAGAPARLIAALRGDGALGAGRAAEVGWNAALPLLGAAAQAYGDMALARACAQLVARWPAPRPYGRTRALAALLDGGAGARAEARGGALYAQGLLRLQELWCMRGGCGVCPLSLAMPGSLAATGTGQTAGDRIQRAGEGLCAAASS